MSDAHTQFHLTDEQTRFFDDEGYVIIDDLFPHADLQPVIDEIGSEVDRMARELHRSGALPHTYEELGFEQRLTAITRHTDVIFKSMLDSKFKGPSIFNMIRHPRLLDLAEQLCGPELIASSVYRLRSKIPGHPLGPNPWHQDSGYFEPYCDKSLIITVWIPLVDATPERGCMWLIPRCHKGEVLAHVPYGRGTGFLQIPDDVLPGKAICVPVRKGGALIMSNRTPHASFENTSGVIRWSMDLRYQTAALPTNAPVQRMPGEVVGGQEPGVPVACYPPEADFLVRSRSRPEQVISDPEQFRKLRENHVSRPTTDRFSLYRFMASKQQEAEPAHV
jgi:hypothetical protein